jgi:hypothetical protein
MNLSTPPTQISKILDAGLGFAASRASRLRGMERTISSFKRRP